MPMVSDLYPADWKEIALFVKEGADWQCQECDLQCRRPGEPFDTHRRTMSVAHYDSDYTSAEIYVVALCSACHNRLDGPFRLANRRRKLRLKRQRAGQMALDPRLAEPECSAEDRAQGAPELEAAWPGSEYLERLEGGVDRWAHLPVAGGE